MRYDTIIVGAGHNGLVTAAYLARAGRKVLVLEKRHLVGGCAVTEEIWPGYRISTASYLTSLLQERIVGTGIGVFLLLRNRSAIAVFGHRRIREKPPSGGVSVYRESVRPAPDLVRRSEALLARLDWEGVAMVEYKVDAKTGEPFLMEINGRFWGSLQLAVDAGADFPRWLVQLAEGTPWEQQPDYRLGVRSRWWWGDVDQMLTRLRRSPAELALPPDDPGLWRSLLAFLTLWRPGDRNEVFRWDDPAPCWRETRAWLRGLG